MPKVIVHDELERCRRDASLLPYRIRSVGAAKCIVRICLTGMSYVGSFTTEEAAEDHLLTKLKRTNN